MTKRADRRKPLRRSEAASRKEVRDRRTTSEQMASLGNRPGKAARERKRLAGKGGK